MASINCGVRFVVLVALGACGMSSEQAELEGTSHPLKDRDSTLGGAMGRTKEEQAIEAFSLMQKYKRKKEEIERELLGARKDTYDANARALNARKRGDEWKKPVAQQANSRSQRLKATESGDLLEAVTALKKEQALRTKLKSSEEEAVGAMRAARWAAREASLAPAQRGALEAARQLVEASRTNHTLVADKIMQRAAELKGAQDLKKSAQRRYESDKQVFRSSHRNLDQRTAQALRANPGWWREPKHMDTDKAASEEWAYSAAAEAKRQLEIWRHKTKLARAQLDQIQTNATAVKQTNKEALEADLEELDNNLANAEHQIRSMPNLPKDAQVRVLKKLRATAWPADCASTCMPLGCKVC